MSRILFELLLLALPFAVYAGWVAFVKNKERESGGAWDGAPITLLLIAGLILVASSLVAMRLTSDDDTSGDYVIWPVSDGTGERSDD